MSKSVQDQVQKILDDACAEKNGAPGLVFGMMDRKGNYLAKAAAGVRGLNRKDEKMTTDTAFAIYSCTKVCFPSGFSLRVLARLQVLTSHDLDMCLRC